MKLSANNGVFPETLTVLQLVKKSPLFYGTRMFIAAFTSARQLFQSWARLIQSVPSLQFRFLKTHFWALSQNLENRLLSSSHRSVLMEQQLGSQWTDFH